MHVKISCAKLELCMLAYSYIYCAILQMINLLHPSKEEATITRCCICRDCVFEDC